MQQTLERTETMLGHAEWQRVDIVFPELETTAKQEMMRVAGQLALQGEVELEYVAEAQEEARPTTTFLSAIQLAAEGDEESRKLVEINVQTDYAERLFKSMHQTEVRFNTKDGQLIQNGRKNVDVLRNTLEYSELNDIMSYRSLTEYKNALLFDMLLQNGTLETHDVLVASPTPADPQTRRKYNFFEETDTMSLQLLRNSDNGCKLETAFVAGKTHAKGQRHDIYAIEKVAAQNGLEVDVLSPDEMLQYVILIPKNQLPDGVTTIVEQYDDAAGGTFYGEATQRLDYQEFAKECRRRDFGKETAQITNQLIAEVATFKNPLDANERLNTLSGASAVKRAVMDRRIKSSIFGVEAAKLIEQSRYAILQGQFDLANELAQQAQKVETSSSCPFARGGSSGGSSVAGEGAGSSSAGEDKYGSLQFECKKGHKNTRPHGVLLEKCQVCKESVRC